MDLKKTQDDSTNNESSFENSQRAQYCKEDVVLYYRIALSIVKSDYWRYNISEEESKVLLVATCNLRYFERFWLFPENFTCDDTTFGCDPIKNLHGSTDENAAKDLVSARLRVRELILGQLVYMMPCCNNYMGNKWLNSLNKLSAALSFNQDDEKNVDVPPPLFPDTQDNHEVALSNGQIYMHSQVNNLQNDELKRFDIDDIYYTLDLIEEFLCEPNESLCQSISSDSSLSSYEETNDYLCSVYDSCGVKNLMSFLKQEVTPERFESIENLVFQIKPPVRYKKQSLNNGETVFAKPYKKSNFDYKSEYIYTKDDVIDKNLDTKCPPLNYNFAPHKEKILDYNSLPFPQSGSINSLTNHCNPSDKCPLNKEKKLMSFIPLKSSTAFRYQQMQRICKDSPFWAKYITNLTHTPVTVARDRENYANNLIRCPNKMYECYKADRVQFEEFLLRRQNFLRAINPFNMDLTYTHHKDLFKDRLPFFPEFQFFASSVPSVFSTSYHPHNLEFDRHNSDENSSLNNYTLDDFSDTCLPVESTLFKKVVQNLEEHAKIKDIFFHIIESQNANTELNEYQHRENVFKTPIKAKCGRLSSAEGLTLTSATASVVMKKIVALLLLHSGFDGWFIQGMNVDGSPIIISCTLLIVYLSLITSS